MKETPESLERLQRLIERSAATAGPAIRRNFVGGGWSMSVPEFVSFWATGRMATISTVSARGTVHAVPLDVTLVDGKFYIATFPDSQRLRDHRVNPRCAITSWDGPYRAVIVYGMAQERTDHSAGRSAQVASEQGYDAKAIVTVVVEPTRIYAIRPPEGHPAAERATPEAP